MSGVSCGVCRCHRPGSWPAFSAPALARRPHARGRARAVTDRGRTAAEERQNEGDAGWKRAKIQRRRRRRPARGRDQETKDAQKRGERAPSTDGRPADTPPVDDRWEATDWCRGINGSHPSSARRRSVDLARDGDVAAPPAPHGATQQGPRERRRRRRDGRVRAPAGRARLADRGGRLPRGRGPRRRGAMARAGDQDRHRPAAATGVVVDSGQHHPQGTPAALR